MPDYVTVEGVELVTVGMEWPSVAGPVSLTPEHLADIVTAANDDPHIVAARVKLGHGAQLVGSLGDHDPYWDGEPAFGSVENLRLENDGAVVVGDLVNVPEWLAEAIPSHWPNRSCEWIWDHTTPGDRHYTAVLTAVALLGAYRPAVADLEDLQTLIQEGPDLLVAAAADPEGRPMPDPVSASVNVATIRQRFNFDWATDPENQFEVDDEHIDPYWWWAREVRVDPLEVIADDDEGNLWRIAVTTDGEDEVTFAEPVRVREVYVDAGAASSSPLDRRTVQRRMDQRVLASNLTRPEKDDPKPAASRSGNDNPDEGGTMPDIDIPALRTRLGLTEEQLPDDADAERVNEILAETPEPPAEPEEPNPEEPEEPETPEVPEAEVPEPVAAGDGTVTVSEEVWSQTQRQAAEGAAARQEQVTERRESLIRAAVDDGRIAPSEVDAWRAKLQETPEASEEVLNSLQKGVIPVDAERGAATEVNADTRNLIRASYGLPVDGKE